MAAASLSVFCSSFEIRKCFTAVAVISCVLMCLPMTVKAMPMIDAEEEGRMDGMMRQQYEQHEQHRQKRDDSIDNCAQPDDLEAVFRNINSGINATHFLQNRANIQSPAVEEISNSNPSVNKTCPTSLVTDPTASLADRSLCPYYFNTLVLPQGYYPATLKTARCKCQRCVQENAYGCQHVKTPIAVLRPVGCFEGLLKYEEEIWEIKSACACALARNTTTTPAPMTTSSRASWGVQK